MTAYYNENDPKVAAWLRELIAQGHIAAGDVDERDIQDVKPDDLKPYTQCHFFAGIGVWSYALRQAGWPDNQPVWTGSCPCQPFSEAGKGEGFADERHLWPAWFHLIGECQPTICFGEQVASKDGLAWLDLVQTDMEATGYAFAPIDLCAAGVGAPHARQRLFFVAERMGNTVFPRLERYTRHEDGEKRRQKPTGSITSTSTHGGMADAIGERFEQKGKKYAAQPATGDELARGGANVVYDLTDKTNGHWRSADWLLCRDGKFRPVEPGTFPLANGVAARVVRLRGYGNAINGEVARIFVESYLEVKHA